MLLRFSFICLAALLLVGCGQKSKVNSYIVPKETSKAVVPVNKPDNKEGKGQ